MGDTRIRETHGVQHAATKLRDAQGRVSLSRLRRHRFGDDAPQKIEIDHVIELAPEPGGASSKQNGILERRAEQLDRTQGSGPRGPGDGTPNLGTARVGTIRAVGTPSALASESSAAA